MRVLVAALVALALAPAARAADVTLTARDVPLGGAPARVLAAAALPFDMVALHWQGPGVPLFSVRRVGGAWTRWIEADDDWGRAGRWRKQGTPTWTGDADAIRYRLHGRVTRLRAYFIRSPVDRIPLRHLALAGGPSIIPRSSWGADESIRRAPPEYADALRFALVHHTVNSNSYTPSQSAAIVRGIMTYHVKGNGWNDIGYNFLVDRYGQVFEGRYGGVERNVIGAHSQGFNTGSVGVAVIGNFQSTAIPAAARNALVQLLAWRLDVAHVDPLSSVTVPSGGNPKFPAGTAVFLRAIAGHRDTYATECPGDDLYAQLPVIARAVAATGLPKLFAPLVTGRVGGPVRFTARLSSALPWTVTVADATGATVASGSGTGPTVDWTWDATAARPGVYRWTIGGDATLRPASGTLGAKPTQLAITGARAVPASISPNGDGVADTSTVSYTLSAAATVTALLVDSAGQTVTQLFSELKPAGKQSFTFSVGDNVPDGAYTIVLQALGVDGQQATEVVGVQIDRTVLDFAASPAAFSPNGDGIQDELTVAFTLAREAGATVRALAGTRVVATLAAGTYPAGAPQTLTWQGPGRDGRYTVQLAVTGAGAAVTRSLPVVVDTRPPALRPISWTRLRFRVSEPATLTVKAGPRRWTKKAKAAGVVSFSVGSPPRAYTVRAQDAAGNSTTLRSPRKTGIR